MPFPPNDCCFAYLDEEESDSSSKSTGEMTESVIVIFVYGFEPLCAFFFLNYYRNSHDSCSCGHRVTNACGEFHTNKRVSVLLHY